MCYNHVHPETELIAEKTITRLLTAPRAGNEIIKRIIIINIKWLLLFLFALLKATVHEKKISDYNYHTSIFPLLA